MSVVERALIRLYPRPCRERWGDELHETVRATGFRSWPNVATGALDMWLHPTLWPTRHGGQRRARAAAMAIAVAGDGWFVANLTTEDGGSRFPPILHGCGLALAVGLLLVAPRPRGNRRALGVLIRRCVLGLALPAVLIAGVVLLVHTGTVSAASPPAPRLATLGIWWGAWLLAAANGCRMLANLGPDIAVAPGRRRSIAGTAVLTATGVVTAAVLLAFAVTDTAFDVVAAASGVLLFALGITLSGTVHELPSLTDDEDATRA
ncbi:hypothetical protein ABIA39_004829 [Nocardia sp. GAS34]|uniref:hypothetical protein n=1 Tax=unclassified Nocardia TaxID=2637762 RepID=UPI003D1D1F42